VVGIAAIGLALMFAHGQAFIAGEGDNRVAVYLAQQKIERCRAQGFASPPTPATLAAAPVTTSQQLDPSQADSDPCYTATPTNTCISGTPVCYTRTTEIVLVCGNDYNTLTTAGCVTTPPPPPPAKRITVTVQAAPKEARQVALTAVLADR